MLKVGDKVKIKRRYDPGASGVSYCNGFLKSMLTLNAGKICTIIGKTHCPAEHPENFLPDDSYDYYLEGSFYTWRSSMFEKERELNFPNLF